MPQTRFTIFDALEKAGAFDSNPANTFARDKVSGLSLYKFQEYPKMLYHPKGEQKEIVAGEWISTLNGPKLVGQQFELINQTVNSPVEEEALRAEGWHDHPAKAIRARIELAIADGKLPPDALKAVPQMSSDQRIKDLEAELARITAARDKETDQRKADAVSNTLGSKSTGGASATAE